MKITRENIIDHLVNYQLDLIGIKLTGKEKALTNWHNKYSITEKQIEEFKKYAIPLLKKIYKFNTKKAKDTFTWFMATFGLKKI